MSINDQLLEAVKSRGRKQTEFAYGILSADVYVRTMQDVIGLDKCYQFFSRGLVSFDDAVKRAARTLVYSNPEMELEETVSSSSQFKRLMREAPAGVELPKNALIVFRHKLTTSRKDRDGDTLHSDGAAIDPKMLLLWQHVHTAPLGPYLYTQSQDDKALRVVSSIIDMNDLCHDAAVMVDNGMGRFSHGFRAVDFTETKADRNGQGGGFDVKKFEVMEESLVSVPANVDAETEEVLLSLVEGGKLTSPVMKSYGRSIRDHRAIQVPVQLDVKVLVNGQEMKGVTDENKSGTRSEAVGGGKGIDGASASEKADVGATDEGKEEERPGDEKVTCSECGEEVTPDDEGNCPECGKPVAGKKDEEEEEPKEEKAEGEGKVTCPECGEEVTPDEDGNCPECGKPTEEEAKDEEEKKSESNLEKKDMDLEKQGRVLSKANETKISDAVDDINEAAGMADTSRPCRALLKSAAGSLREVLSSLGTMAGEKEMTVKDAIRTLLVDADDNERSIVVDAIKAIEQSKNRKQIVEQYRAMLAR